MNRQPARVLESADVCRLCDAALQHRYPLRSQVIILLSFRAGLRACEIAGITWPMALKSNGKIADILSISKHIAKYGGGRRVPVNPALKTALSEYHRAIGRPLEGPIITSERGGHMTAHSIVNWFAKIYSDAGYAGCSSHSGRRTFITQSARLLTKAGGSLRDVQELAGHRSLKTTEGYIEGDRDAQRKLVRLL